MLRSASYWVDLVRRFQLRSAVRSAGIAGLLLAVSEAFVTDGALAQKPQTVATAQEFLQVTSSEAIGFQTLQAETRNHRSMVKFLGPYPNGPCTTKIRGVEDYEYRAIGTPPRWDRILTDNFEYGVYWNLIAKVSRSGNWVRLDWSNIVTPIQFRYPTEELATRAAFAMEFLRMECDPTRNLAF